MLKISGLDKEEIKNYRPISNLPFISKLIEKVIPRRIEEHLEHNDLNDIHQSAYCRGHSTENAFLKVHRVCEALYEGSITALIIIIYSKYFCLWNISQEVTLRSYILYPTIVEI